MDHSTDKVPYHPPPKTTAARLIKNRERILNSWLQRLKKTLLAAKDERKSIIVDTIPAFLENLAQALDPHYPRELATEGTTIAAEHGGERARVTNYSPGEVIKEFQILRDTILRVLSEEQPLQSFETDMIIKSIDQAMGESLTSYFLVQQGIREQFMTVLTHDLRTPLSAIKVTTDLILRYPDRVTQLPILAARISENVHRVDRMIQDLLDASRVRYGERLYFQVEEFDLFDLLQDTLSYLATIHGDRFALHGQPTRGFWNADAFRRAVENLIANAVKYGDPVAPILVRLEQLHNRVIVSVHNEGPYIPFEEQEGLFKSFMRAKGAHAGRKEGWGIGLAMVRGMAEGHGGSITVDSAPDRGTTFIIDVPLDSRPHLRHSLTPGTTIPN